MDFTAHPANFPQAALDASRNLTGGAGQQQPQSNEFYPTHALESLPEHSGQAVPQSQSQIDFAAMKEKINKLMKMENLADITLAGYMIKLLRVRNKMSFRELHDEVSKCYDTLRRSDGSKYTGDLAKALKGCLTSSEIFKEVGENQWGIRDKEAKIYEDKTTKKLKTLINKKKGRSGRKKDNDQGEEAESDDDMSGSDGDDADSIDLSKSAPVKKVKPSPPTNEFQKAVNMLESYSKKLKSSEETADLIKNPIESMNEDESTEEVFQKVGKERFIGMVECFEYFYPLIQEYMKLTAGAGNGSIKVKKEGDDHGPKTGKGKK